VSTTQQSTAVEIVLLDSERQPCEVWSRAMGYHRPVSSWNIGKQQEHRDRKPFVVRVVEEPAGV
jgi:hypothetical protein